MSGSTHRRAYATPCFNCATPTRNRNGCCTKCNRQAFGTRTGQPTYAETLRRRTAVDAWRRQHGDWCPGYQTAPHAATQANPLTADHVRPRSLHGDQGPLTVLCRACNSRRNNGR